MRFSAVFQRPRPQPAAREEPVRAEAAPPAPAVVPVPPVLPDDLDARVRLVGEWQLGES
jgi:hypothetical protein